MRLQMCMGAPRSCHHRNSAARAIHSVAGTSHFAALGPVKPVKGCDCNFAVLQTWLEWQVQAFLAASLKNDEELLGWFNERLVWSDTAVVTEMLKNGLFVRIFAPQVCCKACLPSLCICHGPHLHATLVAVVSVNAVHPASIDQNV